MAFPGLFACLFRNTSIQLEKNHVIPLKNELPPEIAVYHETKKQFQFVNGSILAMKHLEHDKDVDDIQGWELHACGIDEAGQMTAHKINYIISRIRLGGFKKVIDAEVKRHPEKRCLAERLPRFVLSSNPGGISHLYLKEKFIDPAPPEALFYDSSMKDDEDPDDKGWSTIFIPATMSDNQFIDSGYRAQFANMPEWQAKQLRDGDWNAIPGAFFDCWGPKNILKPFAIPDHWTRFLSCDWGFASPFSVGWWAVSDGSTVTAKDGTEFTLPSGSIVRYREWYGCRRKEDGRSTTEGLRIDGSEMAKGVFDRMPDGENLAYAVADPSMWRSDGGTSNAEKAIKAGLRLIRADNEREAGWQQLYSLMKGKGEPMLYVFDTCTDFIRTVPVLEHDEKNVEDITKTNRGGEDHVADDARYAAMSRPRVKKKPRPIKKKTGMTFNEIMKGINKPSEASWRI